jgi:hypothetical protein
VVVPVSLVGPGNIAPIVTAGTNPVATNRLDTSVLFETRGVNGANNTDLRADDLTAAITAVSYDINGTVTTVNPTEFAGIFIENTFVDPATDELVHQISFNGTNQIVANYNITVEYTDAAESTAVNYELLLNEVDALSNTEGVRVIARICENSADSSGAGGVPFVQILVDTATNAADNGYYLYKGTFDQLTNSSNTITLDRTNAATGVVLNCETNFFFTNTPGQDFGNLRSFAKNSGCVEIIDGSCEDPNGASCGGIGSTLPCPAWFISPDLVDTTPYTMEII